MASSRPMRLQSQMVEALSCIICYLPYDMDSRLAKVFPCQHTVCLSCANQLCQQQDDDDVFPCPTCRRPVPIPARGAAGLHTNLDVSNMVEIIQKTKDCSIATLDCPNHPSKAMTNICMTCKVGLCTRCFTSSAMRNHVDHKVLEIDDALEDVNRTCNALVQKGNEMSMSLRKLVQESKDKSSLLECITAALVSAQEFKNVNVLFELMEHLSALLDQTTTCKEEQGDNKVGAMEENDLTDYKCTESAHNNALKGLSHGTSALGKYKFFASDSVVCTKLASVSVLIDVLRLKLHRRETNRANYSDILRYLLELTDDSAPCCKRVVLLGGAALLVACFEAFNHTPVITYKVIAVFCNLAHERSLHVQLLFPSAVKMLLYCARNFPMSQRSVPALTCDALSSFLCNKDARWPQGCLSRDETSQLVMTTCEQLPPDAALLLTCSSLNLFVSFLSQPVSDAAKYWSVWLMNTLTRDAPATYCPMLVRDGGVPVLQQQRHAHEIVRKLSQQILARVREHGQ